MEPTPEKPMLFQFFRYLLSCKVFFPGSIVSKTWYNYINPTIFFNKVWHTYVRKPYQSLETYPNLPEFQYLQYLNRILLYRYY